MVNVKLFFLPTIDLGKQQKVLICGQAGSFHISPLQLENKASSPKWLATSALSSLQRLEEKHGCCLLKDR